MIIKKLLRLVAVVGFVFFASCEKKPGETPKEEPKHLSLEGTYWMNDYARPGSKYELTFTSSTAVVSVVTTPDGHSFTTELTYNYNPPAITFDGGGWVASDEDNPGTVEDDVMTLLIMTTLDQVDTIELKK